MNSSHLKYIISVLSIATGILGVSNLEANASEIQNISKDTSTVQNKTVTPVPISGTKISENATDLQAQTPYPTQIPQQIPQQSPQPFPEQIETPAPTLSPGRRTRGGSSYIGVGGNIGLGGDTTLSEGSFAVNSKIGLTNNFSVRPSALIGDDALFLIPLTLDFPVESVTETGVQQINVAPYIGAGAAISTGQDSTVGFLISGGVDVPLSPEFTANAGVNIGFIDDTEVGLMLGIGYNF
ncbi:MAG: hypothetical protein HC836_14490 [Richelia sp. RM2_1_2]|nr:hypothetical protein [Richelia sp. SM2_1_7]NJM20532.1 hypothetical protein [Richelia sp. SM1_7_0]NJN08253.1 hypothetical protein [Richelia sp. RM1_1_1]NJO27305.1 hypothetical protein [Richelia sp. SL_2_1]NJO59460.1 hypothetical protein [Richelia sp. RM2_1_2]